MSELSNTLSIYFAFNRLHMKKIIFVRHAKSSWEYDLSDINRPLKERGYKDAKIVSSKLLEFDFKIDMVLSSDAVRAMTTAEIFVETMNFPKDSIVLNHSLYDFSGQNVLEVVKSTPFHIETLMIFGHNYALTNIVNSFGSKYIDNVPTSGVVVMQFNITNWQKLNKGETVLTLFPKDLR